MMHGTSPQITELLLAWSDGDEQALDRLLPLVHDELHRLAHRYMAGERPDHPLQTTALVNEAYLRLVDSSRVRWQNRAHFFAVSAVLMRRILVDVARARQKQKRGGDAVRVTFDDALAISHEPNPALIALDDALKALAAIDARKSKVVELRFFGGLSVDETAEVLKVASVTVMRDWAMAKAWLLRELDTRR
jgi:RNA polymerase sigma-70 factor, ECF subfamily